MSQKVKIIGSGPLAGFNMGGTLTGVSIGNGRRVSINFDDFLYFDDRYFLSLMFSADSGCLGLRKGVETDILRVEAVDVPRLDEFIFSMQGTLAKWETLRLHVGVMKNA